MTHRATTFLKQTAPDRKAGIVEIEKRHHVPDRGPVQQIGINPVKPHGIAAPRVGIALSIGVKQVQDTALGDHGVEIEVLLQPLPELHRELVKRVVALKQIV